MVLLSVATVAHRLNVPMHTVVGPLVVTALVIIALGGVYSVWRPSLTFLNSSGSLAIFRQWRTYNSLNNSIDLL
jgi:hypothetical protein